MTTIQKIAWNAHDKIFGMAADIGQHKQENPIPATEEGFYSKAKQREALVEEEAKQPSAKQQRDAERQRMIA